MRTWQLYQINVRVWAISKTPPIRKPLPYYYHLHRSRYKSEFMKFLWSNSFAWRTQLSLGYEALSVGAEVSMNWSNGWIRWCPQSMLTWIFIYIYQVHHKNTTTKPMSFERIRDISLAASIDTAAGKRGNLIERHSIRTTAMTPIIGYGSGVCFASRRLRNKDSTSWLLVLFVVWMKTASLRYVQRSLEV